MTKQQLDRLKSHLLRAKDFGPVLEEFFDLTEQYGFMNHGQPFRDPVIEELVRAAARQLGGEAKNLLLVRMAEHGFVHGGFSVGRRRGGVFYFEDVRMGLASTVHALTGDTRIARFTVSRPQSATCSAN